MSQFYNFGNGSDGSIDLSGTHAPIDSSCSGTAGSTSLSATNASFAPGQRIYIIQMSGTNAGVNNEMNTIASYTAGTITTVSPLAFTYTDSGASQAQVIVMPQYSDVDIGSTLTSKAWDGNVGGVTPILCSGRISVSGGLTGLGCGFRGGAGGASGTNANGTQGESPTGVGSASTSANGAGGGGGGAKGGTGNNAAGGGGGGYVNAGGNGTVVLPNTAIIGTAGAGSLGAADLSSLFIGAGGGGSGASSAVIGVSNGGNGGGIILLFGREVVITGSVSADGAAGSGNASGGASGSGGGAGGSIFIRAVHADIGSGLITANGGIGSGGNGGGGTGGSGSVGRIRIEACSINGSSTPSASTIAGGLPYCGSTVYLF